jgi:hypothetical protein
MSKKEKELGNENKFMAGINFRHNTLSLLYPKKGVNKFI